MIFCPAVPDRSASSGGETHRFLRAVLNQRHLLEKSEIFGFFGLFLRTCPKSKHAEFSATNFFQHFPK